MLAVVVLATAITVTAAYAQDREVARWIGIQPKDAKAGMAFYSRTFTLGFTPHHAWLKFTVSTPFDNLGTVYRAFVNQQEVGNGRYWRDVQYVDVGPLLTVGENCFGIAVRWRERAPSGPILVKLTVEGEGQTLVLRSDETWSYSTEVDQASGWPVPLCGAAGQKPVVVAHKAGEGHWGMPVVHPQPSTATVVGVTDVRMKGGNAGSIFQFEILRDYSDQFYHLKPHGYWSVEDYIYWQANQTGPGTWYWDYDKAICENQREAGFAFTVYPWAWIPPQWFLERQKPVMIRCMEHSEDGFGISLWNPLLLEVNEEMYRQLREQFGDKIEAIYPGIYGDFGEAHYMAGWNAWLRPKPKHQHPDYWTGDVLARADFRKRMREKYAGLAGINKAWSTAFTADDQVAYPPLDGIGQRRWVLDYVDWYYESMTRFTRDVCALAKRYFPDVLIAPKLGCGDENGMWGQDNSAIPEALAEIGVAVRSTHGSSPNFAVRRISSACKFYGNRFETETAGGTNRRDAIKKFFIDASCGCAEIFEYPTAILAVADIFAGCRRHLRGEHSITDVAFFFPTAWHRIHLRQGYPPQLVEAAEELRDIMDFDVVDENMIQDGALNGYRVLVMFDGNVMERATFDKIIAWVERGGALVSPGTAHDWEDVEGNPLEFRRGPRAGTRNAPRIAARGSGGLAFFGGGWERKREYYEFVADFVYRGSQIKPNATQTSPPNLSIGLDDAPMIDGQWDGVWASLLKNRVLYVNPTDQPVTVRAAIPAVTARRLGLSYHPRFLKWRVEIPPKSQRAHFLDRPMVEFALECEGFEGAAAFATVMIDRPAWGDRGGAVEVKGPARLTTAFEASESATYGIYGLIHPAPGASVEVVVDGKALGAASGPAGYHGYMYPSAGTMNLKRGRHQLTLVFPAGIHRADKVMVTTDTGLAGFAYGYVYPDADQTW